MTRWGSAVALIAGVSALAGCGGDGAAPEATPSSALSTAASSPTSAAPTTTPPAGASGVSNGQTYTVTRTAIEGDSADGRGSWSTDFGLLAGGDHAVVEAFNGASHAAAQDQVNAAMKGAADGSTPWTFEADGTVSFRSVVVAQIFYGALTYGAHPTAYVGTVVIDSRSRDPVMLADLFTDPQAALNVIAEQTRAILAKDGLEIPPDEPGAQPKAENFANWIPTADGLEFHFAEYQFGPRLPAVVTVPWSAVADMLTPTMADVSR